MLLNPKFHIFVLIFLQLDLTQSTRGLTKSEIVFLVFFGSVIISWVFHQLLKGKIAINRSSLNLPIFLFLAFCTLSFIKAFYNNVDIIDWFIEWRVFLTLILFFIIVNQFKSKTELKWLIYSFLLTTMLISLRDIFSVVQQEGFESVWQVAGVQYSSLFFIMGIPLSLAIFLSTKNLLLRSFQLFLILLFLFRLSISLMRSYILALTVILSVFIGTLLILRMSNYKQILSRMIALVALVSIISGVVFLVFPVQTNRIMQRNILRFAVLKDFYSPENVSAHRRVVEIQAAWNHAIQQPLLGHGFGLRYQYYGPDEKLHDIPYVHFVPLFFLLKTGVIGILLIVWLIARVLALNWHILKEEKNLSWRLLELALFSNFVGIITLSFFITSVVRIDSIFYFTLAMGIIATLRKLQNNQQLYINPIKLERSHAE